MEIKLSKQAHKDLKRVPVHVVGKLQLWVDNVKEQGLYEVMKIPGYHDELLKGKRLGQRSIRLTRAYRAIYIITSGQTIECLTVLEVNKHAY